MSSGILAVSDLLIPIGIDAGLIGQYSLRDGTNVIRLMEDAQIWANSENMSLQDKWDGLYTMLPRVEVVYTNGHTPRMFEEMTDATFPDAASADIMGHMAPLREFHRTIGATYQYFKSATLTGARLQATVEANVYDGCTTFEVDLLTRLFSKTYEAVAGGWNPPFIDGVTTAGAYAPPPEAGRTFGTSHTHFLTDSAALSSADDLSDMINSLAKTVQHHDYQGVYDLNLLISDDDAQHFLDLEHASRMVQLPAGQAGGNNMVGYDRGGSSSGATFFMDKPYRYGPNEPLTYFLSDRGWVTIRAYPRVPTGYMALYKTYGRDSGMNPLAMFADPNADGFGIRMMPRFSGLVEYPFDSFLMDMAYGFTAGKGRVGAALGRMGHSNYGTPVIAA